MKEFWIDFSGDLKVKANSLEEAENKFWHFFYKEINLSSHDLSDDVWEIECIEEIKQEESIR